MSVCVCVLLSFAVLQVGKPGRTKHSILARGSLHLQSLGKDDQGEWECVATNDATSITASTHLLVTGTQHTHTDPLFKICW